MGRNIIAVAIACLAAAILAGTAAYAAEDPTGCGMKDDPADYERHCSALLENPDLSDEEQAEALYFRGYGRYVARDYRKATADFEAGLKLAPDHARLHRMRGSLALDQEDMETARRHLSRAVELDPQSANARLALGNYHHALDQAHEALENYNRAVELNPTLVRARYNRMLIHRRLRHYTRVLEDSSWLMARDPKDFENRDPVYVYERWVDTNTALRIWHTEALSRASRRKEAEQLANMLVRSERSAVHLVARAQMLARYAVGRGLKSRGPEQIADLRAAVEIEPTYGFAWRELTLALFARRHLDEALEASEQAIYTNVHKANMSLLLWERALILRDLKRTEDAVEIAVLAVRYTIERVPYVIGRLLATTRARGYWQNAGAPEKVDAELIDAVTACMLDPACR